ncbi:glycoside hydrolase superfamily [Geranomyces variabilis]|nr:glycoside hydrolase superfamily [Geranomyces variabilis]KAJ3141148.1 hypothetical protein HDU90_007174 [Geranomyces variabilis]
MLFTSVAVFVAASLLNLAYAAPALSRDPPGRVIRRGSALYLDNKLFRFVSYNAPSLLITQDGGPHFVKPNQWDTNDTIDTLAEQVNRVTRAGTGLGIKSRMNGNVEFHLYACRGYNESAFRTMDYVLDYAAKRGVKLIIPIINNEWHNRTDGTSRSDYHGSWADFSELCVNNRSYSAFFEDFAVRAAFKDFISFMLDRRNTVNGKRWGDDPTLMALATGNELGGWDEPPPPGNWTVDIAQHIKSLAPYLLVADGTLISNDTSRMASEALTSPAVDMFSNHAYFGAAVDIARMQADMLVTKRARKVFWCGEFGLYNNKADYKTVLDFTVQSESAGILIWSLRSHSVNGGFYTHTENDGAFYSLHAPGFPPREPGFGPEESWLVPLLFNYSAKINGMPIPPPPRLRRVPVLLPAQSGANLRWQGVAWASGYDVQRAPAVGNGTAVWPGTWTNIGQGINDNVPNGIAIFLDPLGNSSRSLVFYRVRAIAHGSQPTSYSTPLGPIPAHNISSIA